MMNTIEVYVKGNANTPSRFWAYALLTNCKQSDGARMYLDMGFQFSQKDTDLYNSLTEEQKKKVSFLYVNGVKQV